MSAFDLTPEQTKWVDKTLSAMSEEECIGHLIMPETKGSMTEEKWAELVRKIPIGTAFFGFGRTPEEHAEAKRKIDAIQENSRYPVLIAADMELGFDGGTRFNAAMAYGAVNDPDLLYKIGKALAQEARAFGVHWTFAPVVDRQLNWHNPETNTRAYGESVELIKRLGKAHIMGLQDGGIAATAKHFPGAGMDDRDQHGCTSCNWCTMSEWHDTYGAIYREMVHEAKVKTIMPGHISLPAYEGMLGIDPAACMPATLNRKLMVDLLRGEIGFEGVIVSDASPMIGITTRVHRQQMAVEFIVNGGDVFLFSDAEMDFNALLDAFKRKKLTADMLREKTKRVLELKAWLGLYKKSDCDGKPVTKQQAKKHEAIACEMAERSIQIQKNDGALPLKLKAGSKVLVVDGYYKHSTRPINLDVVVEELEKRGLKVDRLINPSTNELLEAHSKYKHVFLNIQVKMHNLFGATRLAGNLPDLFWNSFWMFRKSKTVTFTSFGTPYLLYEIPHLPNMVLAWSDTPDAQRAAVRAWFGEIPSTGVCPVTLPRGHGINTKS